MEKSLYAKLSPSSSITKTLIRRNLSSSSAKSEKRNSWGVALRKAATIKQQEQFFRAHLPQSLVELWEALRNPVQLEKLVTNFGGCTLRIPARQLPGPGDRLIRVMGKRTVQKLMAHFGGTLLYVPHCRKFFIQQKHAAIVRDYRRHLANGSSGFAAEQHLARKYQLSGRWIRTIVNTTAPASPSASARAAR